MREVRRGFRFAIGWTAGRLLAKFVWVLLFWAALGALMLIGYIAQLGQHP